MTLFRAVRQGIVRAGSAPALLVFLWLVNLLVALPFAASLAGSIATSVDHRVAQRQLAEGYAPEWFGEFEADAAGPAGGFEQTFGPAVVGAGAFLKNLDAWWSGRLFEPGFTGGWGLLAAGALYALAWALLLGGVIDRLAGRGGPAWRLPFRELLAAGARFFFRFVRLAVMAGVLYLLIFLGARWLFGLIEDAMRNVTVERTALGWTLAGFVLVCLLLAVVRTAFDYAKVAVVLEDRRSSLGAALSGFGFVARHPVKTLGLFVVFTVGGLLLLWLYSALAPTAGPASWLGVGLALVLGQLALATRLGLRLATLGGETALYGAEGRSGGVGRSVQGS